MTEAVGSRSFCTSSILIFWVILLLLPLSEANSKCIIFNFGDSNSDTGGFTAGLGFYLGPPYGREFFNRTTGRWCDGRLYVDFICQYLKINFLSPYLESSGSDFFHGVNFAVAGATIGPNNSTFPLNVQVGQFLHFKNQTQLLLPQGRGSLIKNKGFKSAIYSIDIGQNDIAEGVAANLSFYQIIKTIPRTISEIKDSIKQLYVNGALKFLIYNTGPLGCLPQKLALDRRNNSKFDKYGCLADHNVIAEAFNDQLLNLCSELRSELKHTTIVYIDMFSIKFDLVANHEKYGIRDPLMACCGHGGAPYNYVNLMTCGQPTARACPSESRFISWDGVHYTQFANHIVSSKILSGNYSDPPSELRDLCSG